MALSGGKGNSRANTQSSSSTTNTTVTNVDNRVNTSDFGAITGAFDVVREALRQSTDVNADVLNFGGRALDTNNDVVARSLDSVDLANTRGMDAVRDIADSAITRQAQTVDSALDTVSGIAGDAIHDVRGSGQDALDFGRDALAEVSSAGKGILDFARDIFSGAIDSNRQTVRDNIEGLTALAQDTSQTADDRIVKVVGYSIAGVALAFIALANMRKG
jgi:hypothetical protein